jgi:hypothetical protein
MALQLRREVAQGRAESNEAFEDDELISYIRN